MTKVIALAHRAPGARGFAELLARAMNDNQVEIKMDYQKEDLDGLTGAELDETKADFAAAGVSPSGWRRMKVAEKRDWLKANLGAFMRQTSRANLPAHVREKKAWGTRKARQKAMVEKFGNYVTNGRMQPYIAAMNGEAPDPQPMTRQVLRQHRRRANKAALSAAKIEALKSKLRGGAAVVLSAETRV